MRCPDCQKFVSMENGDPEINDITVYYSSESLDVTVDLRHTRNCADCSTELKSVDASGTETIELCRFDGWDKLSEEERAKVVADLQSGAVEATVEHDSSDADESGGGRYKKNIITINVTYTVKIEIDVTDSDGKGITLEYNGSMAIENAAGNYEECC